MQNQANSQGVRGPTSATDGNIALYNGTTGKLIKDAGKGVPSGAIVGISDTQTLTNKTIDGSQLVNSSVSASKLATSAASATIATSEGTTSATFTDLTTPGPAVTVTIGANGLALVTVSAELFNNTLGDYAVMGFAVSGASTIAAAVASSLYNKADVANNSWRGSYTTLVTGLTAGSTTFTAKYERITGGTATFVNREISVVPL